MAALLKGHDTYHRYGATNVSWGKLKRDVPSKPKSIKKNGPFFWLNHSLDIDSNHILANLAIRIRVGKVGSFNSDLTRDLESQASPANNLTANSYKKGIQAVTVTNRSNLNTIIHNRSQAKTERRCEALHTVLNQQASSYPVANMQPIILPRSDTSLEKCVNKDEFLAALVSKQSCIDLQAAITSAPIDAISHYVSLVKENLEIMVETRRGTAILSRLIQRSEKLSTWFTSLPEETLLMLTSKENSSRMLQFLMLKKPDFVKRSLMLIRKYYDTLIANISSVFFICVCVRQARRYGFDPQWIFDALLSDCAKVLTSKYRKRILMTFLEHPEELEMSQIFQNLIQTQNIERIMRDKFLSLITGTLINLGYRQAEEYVTSALEYNSMNIYIAPFFKTFLAILDLKSESHLLRWIIKELLYFKERHIELKIDDKVKQVITAMYNVCMNTRHYHASTDNISEFTAHVEQATGFSIQYFYKTDPTCRVAQNRSVKKSGF